MAVGIIISFLAGAAVKNGVLPRLSRDHDVVDISGRVVSPPVKNSGNLSFFLAVSEVSAYGRTWKTGERLLVRLDAWKEKENYVFPGSNLNMQGKMTVAGKSSGWLLDSCLLYTSPSPR